MVYKKAHPLKWMKIHMSAICGRKPFVKQYKFEEYKDTYKNKNIIEQKKKNTILTHFERT